MLLGWSSISIASLTIQSIYLDLLVRILVLCSWIQLVYAVFSYDGLLRMLETDVLMMFFDPRLNRMSSLSDVHLSALAADAVYTWRF
jgi:hypothetical protein